jgi:hypothetical protein
MEFPLRFYKMVEFIKHSVIDRTDMMSLMRVKVFLETKIEMYHIFLIKNSFYITYLLTYLLVLHNRKNWAVNTI